MDVPTWLNDAIVTFGYFAIAIAVGLESMGVPFPGETALLAGAIYSGTRHEFNIAGVIAAAAIGAILGDNIGFAIGHFGGYPLVRRLARLPALRFLHLDESALAGAQRFFDRHGGKTVFIGRFFSILRTYAAFLAGVNRMHWRTFLLWNAAGGIVWATLYGLLGYFLGHQAQLLGTVLRVLGTGGAILLVLFLLVVVSLWVRRREKALRSQSGTPDTGEPGAREDTRRTAETQAEDGATETKTKASEPRR